MKGAILIAGVCALVAAPAGAEMYKFYGLTSNRVADVATGEAQLSVDVTASGSQTLFTFRNAGPNLSSITDVYFDDGTLLAIASITNGPDVSFSQGASPHNLPSGNTATPPFEATAGFLADSDGPTQPNGVNPGDWLEICFGLQSGGTFNDVIRELASGELRIGIHVQGFADGGSESFINDPQVVPVPGAVLLGALGLCAAGLRLRRGV